jgi:hypothetical protein
MLRAALILLLSASPALAQNSAANVLAGAGCGANEVHFDVKTDKKQHPMAQPEAGKALVYVIGDTSYDHAASPIGAPTLRFGVDGTWVGANGHRSYFYFSIEPGEHRLCTNVQSAFESTVKRTTAAATFNVEAGKVYYFRTRTPERPETNDEVRLVPVDPAEAQVLIARAAFSTFHVKK